MIIDQIDLIDQLIILIDLLMRDPSSFMMIAMEKTPDFDTLMRRLEKVLNQIRDMKHEIEHLEWERDALKKLLKAYAAGSADSAAEAAIFLGTAHKKNPSGVSDAIKETVDAVREAQRTVDPEWLAKKLDIGRDAAAIRLIRAHKAGLLARPTRGKYFFPMKGTGPTPPDVRETPEDEVALENTENS